MRYLLVKAGEYMFYDEPANRGFLGGRIIAVNPDTDEEVSKTYKKFHTGKTDKFEVLSKLLAELAPPEEEINDEEEPHNEEEERVFEVEPIQEEQNEEEKLDIE